MTRKPRIPSAERAARRRSTRNPGVVLTLTHTHATQESKRKKKGDHRAPAQVVTNLKRLGLIEEAPETNSRLARQSSDPQTHAVLPVGQVVALYNSIRTPDDRDVWIRKVDATLAAHSCGSRCMCGRLRRLRATLVDSYAVENKVTPWLPNPRVQVPGSACSNER